MTWVQRCEWLCMHIILWLLTLTHTLASTSPHRSAGWHCHAVQRELRDAVVRPGATGLTATWAGW